MRTNAYDEGGETNAADDVFDEVLLAGSNHGGGHFVVFVVVGGAGHDLYHPPAQGWEKHLCNLQ